MRKTLIPVILFCFFFSFKSVAFAADWLLISHEHVLDKIYLDADSVTYVRSPDNKPISYLINFWIKTEMSESTKNTYLQIKKNEENYDKKWDTLIYSKNKYCINIESREIAMTELVYYDDKGKVLFSYSNYPMNFESIVPESKGEEYLDMIKIFLKYKLVH